MTSTSSHSLAKAALVASLNAARSIVGDQFRYADARRRAVEREDDVVVLLFGDRSGSSPYPAVISVTLSNFNWEVTSPSQPAKLSVAHVDGPL